MRRKRGGSVADLSPFQIIDEISTRSKDIIIGVGERLSCRIVVAVLKDRVGPLSLDRVSVSDADSHLQGVDAELVSLENIVEPAGEGDETTGSDSQRQLGQPFYDRLSKRLGERLNECADRVPVVTGEFRCAPVQTRPLSSTSTAQASSVLFLDHYLPRSVVATAISARRCARLACPPPSCKSGRK